MQARNNCVHSKGGICSIHGAGAKLKWKPSARRMPDKKKSSREYFYVYDVGLGERRLMQTRLLFDKMTSPEITRNRNLGE